MTYKSIKGKKISTLGMGNMRLPKDGGGHIDEKKALEIIDYAYQNGVNYYDTAYRYHSGESELFIGKALSRYPRDTWYLATKFPGHMMQYKDGKLEMIGYLSGETIGSVEEVFEDQLERCGVEYFDFYLLHNVSESSFEFYTNEKLNIMGYLRSQKEKGRIRHLGFSSHGRADTIKNFLDLEGDCIDIVQIQLNYLDWKMQQAEDKYELLVKREMPIVAMEPVRGGSLASLGEESDKVLKAARPDYSIASWAFRYLQSLPGIYIALSGMTTLEQITENVKIFSNPEPMSDSEKTLLEKAMQAIIDLIPCTSCRYCCEGCPKELDIPKLISMYNEMKYNNAPIRFAIKSMEEHELPSACISCGSCAKLCPQNIDIPAMMTEFDKMINR